jgi:dihydropteroate synthase
MGVLNVTPDSFSERGTYFDRKTAIARGLSIEREGADLLDIGGESTRPDADPVSAEEELDRTIPVIEALLRKGLRIPISMDTYKSQVAERALLAGAEIVNDISGLRYDSQMAPVIAKHRAAAILMHLRGTPQTMQKLPRLQRLIPTIRQGLIVSVRRAMHAGIPKDRIVIDPGIGFGKSGDQNFELIANLHRFSSLGFPVLAGPSRKSFIRRTIEELHRREHREKNARSYRLEKRVEVTADELLYGTAATVAACILNGAHIVRVHDVSAIVAVARVTDQILGTAVGSR